MKQQAMKDGKTKKNKKHNYTMIDKRIAIATKEKIGNKLKVSIGSYVNVEFKYTKKQKIESKKVKKAETVVYKCIIVEFKGSDATNPWGHDDGKSVVEMVYYNKSSKCKNNPWGTGKVVKIKKIGKKYKYKYDN